jgi:dTDP-4-amino-4,6-dideoxygalactose transaminase
MGRVQMRRLPGFMRRRRELADQYFSELAGIPGLELPYVPAYAMPNYQSFPVRITDSCVMRRDELMQALLDHGVSTRRGIMNAHQEEAYAGLAQYRLPESESARDSVVLLPLFNDMSDEQQSVVIEQIRFLCGVGSIVAAK